MKHYLLFFILLFSYLMLCTACRSSRESLQMQTQTMTVNDEQRTSQLSILAVMDSVTYFVQQQTNTLTHQLRDSTRQLQSMKEKEPVPPKSYILYFAAAFFLILFIFFLLKKL